MNKRKVQYWYEFDSYDDYPGLRVNLVTNRALWFGSEKFTSGEDWDWGGRHVVAHRIRKSCRLELVLLLGGAIK